MNFTKGVENMARKLGVAGLQLRKHPDNPTITLENFEKTVKNTKA